MVLPCILVLPCMFRIRAKVEGGLHGRPCCAALPLPTKKTHAGHCPVCLEVPGHCGPAQAMACCQVGVSRLRLDRVGLSRLRLDRVGVRVCAWVLLRIQSSWCNAYPMLLPLQVVMCSGCIQQLRMYGNNSQVSPSPLHTLWSLDLLPVACCTTSGAPLSLGSLPLCNCSAYAACSGSLFSNLLCV